MKYIYYIKYPITEYKVQQNYLEEQEGLVFRIKNYNFLKFKEKK